MVVDSSLDCRDLAPGRSRGGPRCARPWPWSLSHLGPRRRRCSWWGDGSARCSPGGAWGSAMEGCVPRQLGYPPRASLASQEVTNYGSATNHGAKNTLLDRQKLCWTWLRYWCPHIPVLISSDPVIALSMIQNVRVFWEIKWCRGKVASPTAN
jgi:hypothetical protein